MRTILLTGASGVVGYPILKKLVKQTNENRVIGTYFSNQEKLLRYINKDFTEEEKKRIEIIDYRKVLSPGYGKEFDEIWHLATYGQPGKAISQACATIKLNVSDTINLVRMLKDDGYFYYASTSEMYGNVQEASEDDIPKSDPKSKRGIYTESKRLGEAIINNMLNENGVIFRICLVYSKYAKKDDTRVMYNLIGKAIREGVINLLDDGQAERQYCHVDDAIEMMLNINNKIRKAEKGYTGVWNIANPDKIKIIELADKIAQITNTKVNIPKQQKRVLDALDVVSVIPKRYTEQFGHKNYICLDDGLKEVIESYVETLEE